MAHTIDLKGAAKDSRFCLKTLNLHCAEENKPGMDTEIKRFIDASVDEIEQQIKTSAGLGETPVTALAASSNAMQLKSVLESENGRHFINMGNRLGISPLTFATKNNQYANVRLLVQAGADVLAVDIQGETAMHSAAQVSNRDICRILLKHGVPATTKNCNSETPLHFAAIRKDTAMALEVVDLLIEAGANVNAVDVLGDAPLHLAVESGNKEICDKLIAAGADITLRNVQGLTPDDMPVISTIGSAESHANNIEIKRSLRKSRLFSLVPK